MKVTRVPSVAGAKAIDLCPRCQLAWFDRGELEALSLSSPEPSAAQLESEARTAFARLHGDEARDADLVEVDPFTARGTAGLADLPSLLGDRRRAHLPWLTVTLAALLVGGFVFQTILCGLEGWLSGPYPGSPLDRLLRGWGLVPADPLRRGGLTLLTSSALHLGLVHALVNAWFLVVAGQPLEGRLGPWRFLIIYLGGVLGGDLLDVLLRWGASEPSVGASGGISALFAVCALALPHLKLGFTVGAQRNQAESAYYQLRIGVRWIFAGWILLQLLGLGAVLGSSSGSRISFGAHLGGALAGAALWYYWLRRRSPCLSG